MRHSTVSQSFAWALPQAVSLEDISAPNGRDGDTHPLYGIADSAPTAAEQIDRARAIADVTKFINTLSTRDQEMVRRLFWFDENQSEVASQFGLSRMAISKAMAKIAKRGRIALAAHE
jgi:DNA-directed RNA polymerase specialized sigma subunit